MKTNRRSFSAFAWQALLLGGVSASLGLAVVLAVPTPSHTPLEAPTPQATSRPDGKELFAREWIAGDPRSHAGDGLGPMFNDSSCVACHNQGGPGGGGPASKNVQILTSPVLAQTESKVRQHQSFVLHLFSTDPEFAKWRATTAQAASGMQIFSGRIPVSGLGPGSGGPMPAGGSPPVGGGGPPGGGSGGFGTAANQITQRNATALFGAGRIDAIKEEVLEKAAARKYAKFPQVAGHVARDEMGRAGRFGWKAQKSGLEDFVLTACSVELGLQVPGHDQPPMPHDPNYKAKGLDLTKAECDALVDYVASLPAPAQQKPALPKQAEYLAAGKKLFETVGCATCHTPKLGDVEGIYSDLLLHDMGPGLTDMGSSYGIFQPNPPPKTKPEEVVQAKAKRPAVLASAQEWRTPPLWGVRDSAPYLHDGRANSLEDAIALHGGQAQDSTKQFNALSAQDKQKLVAFLKSLVAPDGLAMQ